MSLTLPPFLFKMILRFDCDLIKSLISISFMNRNDIKSIVHIAKLCLGRKINRHFSDMDFTFHRIRFITFRSYFPNGGAGGAGAVLSANRRLFGYVWNNVPLQYTFAEQNKYSKSARSQLRDLFGAVQFVKEKTKYDDAHVAYVTHDYGTAFGLYLLGKNYILVSHIQGTRAEEKKNFGEAMSFITKHIIMYCEKMAFKHARKVCFPSNGAYEYFKKSKSKTIKTGEFKVGSPLYNTLYACPSAKQVNNLVRDDSYITILSVGQLTVAKGMDQHPEFLREYLKLHPKRKVRYIMVGKGPLCFEITSKLYKLNKEFPSFSYVIIPGCTYPQMLWLQNICDIYLMLHRISIFDLTTLELMNKGKCVVISDVGGNPEFNLNDNIILVHNERYSEAAHEVSRVNLEEKGKLNKKVYDKFFSHQMFRKAYFSEIFSTFRFCVNCNADSNSGNRIIVNKINGSTEEFVSSQMVTHGFKINISGKNNKVVITEPINAHDSEIEIKNDDCDVRIGRSPYMHNLKVRIDRGTVNKLNIGNDTTIWGCDIFLNDEKTSVTIGSNCAISRNVSIYASDGHLVLNKDGQLINDATAASIFIGNRVWIGQDVRFLKNSGVGNDSVIAMGSVVNRKYDKNNVLLAGVPAKVKKEGISWIRENAYLHRKKQTKSTASQEKRNKQKETRRKKKFFKELMIKLACCFIADKRKRHQLRSYLKCNISEAERLYNRMPDIRYVTQLYSRIARKNNIGDGLYREFWLQYICLLLRENNQRTAKKVLKRYVCGGNGLQRVEAYLPVAQLAVSMGIGNDKVDISASAFEQLKHSQDVRLIEKLVQGKSVAIVGNGPSEVGKKRGAEIDAHDIVIRFNNYQIDGYEEDYGSKTDIWIKTSASDVKHDIRDNNIKAILYTKDYELYPVLHGYQNIISNSGIPSACCTLDDYVILRKALRDQAPSSGLLILQKIFNCKPLVLDCYGFHFMQEIQNNVATHYYRDRSKEESVARSRSHSFLKESAYIKQLLKLP